jgi:hypothetical protein
VESDSDNEIGRDVEQKRALRELMVTAALNPTS